MTSGVIILDLMNCKIAESNEWKSCHWKQQNLFVFVCCFVAMNITVTQSSPPKKGTPTFGLGKEADKHYGISMCTPNTVAYIAYQEI